MQGAYRVPAGFHLIWAAEKAPNDMLIVTETVHLNDMRVFTETWNSAYIPRTLVQE